MLPSCFKMLRYDEKTTFFPLLFLRERVIISG